jgi:hypothetical protein
VNTNFVVIINRIIAEQGEDILANPQRVRGYVNDYASRESKPERLAFGHCIEYGAYTELKNAPDAEARQRVKAAVAQRVNSNEGLELALCNDALDVLDAAVFGVPTPHAQTERPEVHYYIPNTQYATGNSPTGSGNDGGSLYGCGIELAIGLAIFIVIVILALNL